MDEESILNFWISQEKPKDLPEGWLWTDDMLNISVIFDAYRILHPDNSSLQCIHYICAPWKMKEEIEFWFPNYIAKNFFFIWRPIFCDPNYEPVIEIDLSLDDIDLFLDDYYEEDDEDCEEEEEDNE